MKKSCILFSGGLDCLINYLMIKDRNPDLLYITTGLPVENTEIECIKRLEETGFIPKVRIEHNIFNFKSIELPDRIVPLRNMYFIMYAATLGYDIIYIASEAGSCEKVIDKSDIFMEKISELLSYLFKRDILITSTIYNIGKSDMVKWFKDNGYPEDLLRISTSCYDEGSQCGICSSCVWKAIAMKNNNMSIDIFDKNPFESKSFKDLVSSIDSKPDSWKIQVMSIINLLSIGE